MLQAILKPNLNLASLVSAVPALWSSYDTQLWAIFRRQPNWAASAELPCKHLTTNLSARGSASTLTHCWSGRESPRHLLYVHYYSSFVTLAVEVNLLPVVDVLCRSNMFLFAGSRHYASETTSVGTGAWFCQHSLFHSPQKMSNGNSSGCPLSYFAPTLLLESHECSHQFGAPCMLERSLSSSLNALLVSEIEVSNAALSSPLSHL